jgi:hypothetical protein
MENFRTKQLVTGIANLRAAIAQVNAASWCSAVDIGGKGAFKSLVERDTLQPVITRTCSSAWLSSLFPDLPRYWDTARCWHATAHKLCASTFLQRFWDLDMGEEMPAFVSESAQKRVASLPTSSSNRCGPTRIYLSRHETSNREKK